MRKQKNVIIRFEPEGRIARGIKEGESLLNVAMEVGAGLRSECGGKGSCKKCLVHPEDNNFLSPPSKREEELIADKLEQGFRLACQAIIKGSGTVFIPPESRTTARIMQTTGKEQIIELDPRYRKVHLSLQEPSLEDQRSDLTRIIEGINEMLGVNNTEIGGDQVIMLNPNLFREADWHFTVTLKENEVVEIIPGSCSSEVLGVALDIGTSKIVGHLIDLTTGKTLAVTAVENPQLIHGEDIISRVRFAGEKPENIAVLQEKVVNSINKQIIINLVKDKELSISDIYSLVVVGNAAMQHLFLGIDPCYLGRAPYVPAVTSKVEVKASKLGIKANPSATMTVFPAIGGVIGGDCVAVALATGMDITADLSMAVDIGTNTEIILGNKEGLTATSCASGPAFEGYHIHDGMKAVEGAIEHMTIDPGTFEVDYQVIGGVKPTGICGSAILDCLAELVKTGLVDKRGRLKQDPENKRLIGEKRERALIIARPDETATGKSVVFTQEDIRSVQLAKAAILTGAYLLMKKTGTEEKDIKHVYLAGAFGNHIKPENARIIGLLPDFPHGIEYVGNAAVSGAKRALLSRKELLRAENIARGTRFLELALDEHFQQEYARAMYLPYEDLGRFLSIRDA